MAQTWVLVAHRSGARIFKAQGPKPELNLVKDLPYEDASLRKQAFRDDKAGRLFNHFSTHRHTAEKKNDEREQLLMQHAKNIADFLQKSRAQNKYSQLVLVAEPKLLGQLRNSLDKNTQAMVLATLDRDLSHEKPLEIANHIKPILDQTRFQNRVI